MTLDDGTEIRFDGANEFANLQVSHDPTHSWVLVASVITLLGVVGSLTVKRRRIWVRMYPDNGGTRVETAGLARTDRAGWGDEYREFHRTLLGLPEEEE